MVIFYVKLTWYKLDQLVSCCKGDAMIKCTSQEYEICVVTKSAFESDIVTISVWDDEDKIYSLSDVQTTRDQMQTDSKLSVSSCMWHSGKSQNNVLQYICIILTIESYLIYIVKLRTSSVYVRNLQKNP